MPLRAGPSPVESGDLERETMTKPDPLPACSSSALAAGLFAGLLAGCGQFKLPEATTPPDWAPIGERAPEFTVGRVDRSGPGMFERLHSTDFAGGVLVAMGAAAGFVGELLPWLEELEARYGKPRRLASSGPGTFESGKHVGRYSVLLIVERTKPRELRGLKRVMPDEYTLLIDPNGEFAGAPETERNRFGFVGEGPHIAVISADGTLLALIDGPVSKRRLAELKEAMDRALSPPDVSPPDVPPPDVPPPVVPSLDTPPPEGPASH